MAIVLKLDGVGKCYTTYRSNLARFASWFGAPVKPISSFWANRNIDFNLERGQALALIGQNGAGKSTLLKMITGTVRPTVGQISVGGRINAILELGLGFNPEFTGRQNVFQAGGLMGMSQQELASLMPAIEEFAEIGDFFDKPLRVYSSGMQARLAFALATAKPPDILIVDEVLSVGDSYFQHKSFDRIRKFKEDGVSIILVTHSLGDVRTLCDRVILLDKGEVLKDGAPDEVVDYYNAMVAEKENSKLTIEQRRNKDGWLHTRSGDYAVVLRKIDLIDAEAETPVATAAVGQNLILRVEVEVVDPVPALVVGVMLRDRGGHVIWGTNTWHTDQSLHDVGSGEKIRFDFEFRCDLGPGSYSFSTALTRSDTHIDTNYEWQDNVIVFDVANLNRPFFIGTTFLDARIGITRA
jgi:lipopolysaccharide transport system ATP-binding protein